MRRSVFAFGTIVLVLAALLQPASGTAHAVGRAQGNQFVKRAGADLRLNGKLFRFAGTNNYYLMYKSPTMVDDVIDAAARNDFRVLRTWGSLEIGNQDGSNSINGKSEGVYFQYWDGARPAYNDGADGLERMDYVIARAGQAGLKLVIPLVNNWNAFGGMDQYVRWRDTLDTSSREWYHDDFYTDPLIRSWYRSWIEHVLNRTNTITGVRYKDDPTIMTWELANEPRCLSAGAYGRSANCTTGTLTAWADEMSTYIRSLDNKHLISVGDEGFTCAPNATDWTENCGEGVDTIALTQLKNIDVMSFHLYPDHWGKTADWGTEWIRQHFAAAARIGKPAMLGEFGVLDKATRNVVYKQWTDAVFDAGGAGALYWILSGIQDDGSLYPDYDGFTVYAKDPVFRTLGNFADMMNANRRMEFPPVADDDAAVTEFGVPATLAIAANDITYGGATLRLASIDLDPGTMAQQTTRTVAGGTFAWQPDGTIVFTPAASFAGKATISYTIVDSAGRVSNPATITVTVKPNPTGALSLFSFESGTEGWKAQSWNSGAGTTEQSADWATDGTHSLKITGVEGGWFGLDLSPALDLTGKTHIKYDLKTLGAGSSTDLAISLGESYTWCQGAFSYVNAGTTTTVDIDLLAAGCDQYDMTSVRQMNVFVGGSTIVYIDNIRAE